MWEWLTGRWQLEQPDSRSSECPRSSSVSGSGEEAQVATTGPCSQSMRRSSVCSWSIVASLAVGMLCTSTPPRLLHRSGKRQGR